MYFDKKLKTNAYIHGKTFVKPGKYDSLYPDAEYYVKDANTKMGLKLKLLNYAVKTYRSNDYLVLVYFAESLLIAIVLALVAYIHVCENGKKVRRMMKIFVRRFDGEYAKRMFLMKKEREEKNE